LERIDYNNASHVPENWHSAAFSSGFGTPTARNSQYQSVSPDADAIGVAPKTFSPDNDGQNDVLAITYSFPERGFLANVNLFDASGILVRHLKRNDLLGFKGNWVWDGLNDKNEKLPTGIYIVWVEIFNLQGIKKQFKKTVVLARPLQ
jgi:flagellar hook assembly protein FlgD